MNVRTILLGTMIVVPMLLFHQVLGMAEEGGPGGEIVYTKPVKAVIFSHKTHAEGLGLDCTVCHDKLFKMAGHDAQSKQDFTMKGLYGGKYCGACHAPNNIAFAADTQCARCHIGSKGLARAEKAKQMQKK